jgi:hypothetical protein
MTDTDGCGRDPGWYRQMGLGRSRDHDICGKKQEPPFHLSCEDPTELVCLQELRKRLHDPSRHDKCVEAFGKERNRQDRSRHQYWWLSFYEPFARMVGAWSTQI